MRLGRALAGAPRAPLLCCSALLPPCFASPTGKNWLLRLKKKQQQKTWENIDGNAS
jgi:hypothetical protein